MSETIQVSGFPSNVTAAEVKIYLENYSGNETVYALKIRQCKIRGKFRAFAVVQFTTTGSCELISSLISERLCYGRFHLKVRKMERNIIPRPRVLMLSLESTVLHVGCQVSDEKFIVFWKGVDAVVNFEFGLRKIEFLFSHCQVEYKLELSYDSIWQIQLYRPSKYLVIQVFAAPRIYEKLQSSREFVYEDPTYNYFRDTTDDQWVRTTDDQWVRTTDFTTLSCIGQSSGICLELPRSCDLSKLGENFPFYKEVQRQFSLETGPTYSISLDLVPIVGPPRGLELPYEILFKVNALVQNGCLAGPTLDTAFFSLIHPLYVPLNYIERALESLYHLKSCCYEPVTWLSEQYTKYQTLKTFPRSPTVSLDDGLVYIRRVQVTPSKVYFYGPEVNVSNRVLRRYHRAIDNFIRISFIDEDWEKLYSSDLSPRSPVHEEKRQTAIYKRVLAVLRNGIVIGDKKFEFLAFSSSQLRDNSGWMFASAEGITAATIREWMGDFRDIRNVAKYAARLGQSFSSSTETLTVRRHEIETIPDIEIEWNRKKYTFSDGIGKISAEFALRVARKCSRINSYPPSAFQIRYGGYKGVVAVDPTTSKKLSLRKSMSKYSSKNTKLDVLSWSKFQPCFLNRQLITLLSTLGVKDQIFEKKQKETVDQLDLILTDPLKAQEALEVMSTGEHINVLKEMLACGYKPDTEPFLSMMLQGFRALKLLDLRKKSRIFVPNGRSLMGCLDETRTLNYGQVFVQVSGIGQRQFYGKKSFKVRVNLSGQQSYVVEGKMIVAKNPCLHPGDVRVLSAVNVPALHHMTDCIVFPQKGSRPHPNECSGSDLDGDVYFVSWDSELIPPRQVCPMDYTAEPSTHLDHDVTIEEVQEYFTNYIVNDSLGIIANAHTAFADKEINMADSEACIELARLFSIAVDFPKTGFPAVIPPHLHVKDYPDFMEKPDKQTYESHRVIGKLFRAVKDIAPHTAHIKSFTREVAMCSYDKDMEVDGFENYLDDAYYCKGDFDFRLGNLLDYYGIKTEAEILGGSIMKMSKSFDRRNDAEAIGLEVRSLKKEARAWFDKDVSGSDDMYAKASAWYHVTYHPDYWGCYNEGMNRAHFLSFPWCVYDKLIHIKQLSNLRRRLGEPVRLS